MTANNRRVTLTHTLLDSLLDHFQNRTEPLIPRAVDIETFGEPHAVRLRVLRHRKKPVASRYTARPKRLTQDRVRYSSATRSHTNLLEHDRDRVHSPDDLDVPARLLRD